MDLESKYPCLMNRNASDGTKCYDEADAMHFGCGIQWASSTACSTARDEDNVD